MLSKWKIMRFGQFKFSGICLHSNNHGFSLRFPADRTFLFAKNNDAPQSFFRPDGPYGLVLPWVVRQQNLICRHCLHDRFSFVGAIDNASDKKLCFTSSL
jgi:hypothetical protein